MALIANAAYQNETFRQVFTTRQYEIAPTPQYTEPRYLYNHHKMMQPDTEYYYEGCLGGKTGYTEAALNTLVTFASRNGKTLLCVTMRTQGRQVYTDTASLFDYGFTQTFPAGEAALLTVTEPAATETPTPEPGSDTSAAPDAEHDNSGSEEAADDSGASAHKAASVFPVWIPLTAIFVIAAGLLIFRIFLTASRRKRRKRRRRRR